MVGSDATGANMLSRGILAPRDAILDVAEFQRIALLFDHILIWNLERERRNKAEQDLINQEVEFLREMDVVKLCGPSLPIVFRTKEGGRFAFSQNLDFTIPYESLNRHIVLGAHEPMYASNADRVVHQVSSGIIYKDAPVAAHVAPSGLVPSSSGDAKALRVVLDQIPFPAGDMPWQDFVQFRKDPENISSLRALRRWVQSLGDSKESVHVLEDELLYLLDQYRTYMRIQGIKCRNGSLAAVVSALGDAAVRVVTFRFGSAVKSFLDIRSQSIDLELAELSAPGREVSYVARAQALFQGP